MAVLNGTDLTLKRAGTAITFQTECSISFEREEIDITSKNLAGKKGVIAGKRSASLSFSGFLDNAGTNNYTTLLADWTNGTATTFELTNGLATTSLVSFSGSCILTSFEVSAGVEDSVQISGSFVVTGTVAYDNDGTD
jgi:predicted secreted protein